MQFKILDVLDWLVEDLLPYFFVKLDSLMIVDNVSIIGFSVAITVLVIAIGAVVLRV